MRIGIIGTGAMGSFLAAHFVPQHEVTVLGTWSQAVDEMNRNGILFEHDNERVRVPVHATTLPQTVHDVDYALIAVKGHQTERAARWAHEILGPSGIAVTLQNGLGNYETLVQHVGEDRAGMGVTMLGATLLGPGHVRYAGRGLTTLAATTRTQGPMQVLCDLLNRAGVETQMTNDLASLIWGKLVVNSAINALSAIYRVPNGRLVEHPETRALLTAAAQETANVASALGIDLPYLDPVARTIQVATATAANKSSTLQDVLRGAPTELDRINGAVIVEGKRLGVPTPVNEQLMRVMSNRNLPNHSLQAYMAWSD